MHLAKNLTIAYHVPPMAAELMTGKPVVDMMLEQMESEPDAGLTVVQLGDEPESASYVKQMKKTAARLSNLRFDHRHITGFIESGNLQNLLIDLNMDPAVTGYMLQMPLPPDLSERMEEVRSWIKPGKDVDILGNEQRGIFLSKKSKEQLLPPTPYAVMKMLQYYRCDVRGKIVVVVGDGQVGGMLKIMLGNDKATQVVCNEHTPDLADMTRQGDIVIGAAGVPDLIRGDMIKQDAVVINVGMKDVNGEIKGDVDVESVRERAKLVTPVFGGLGPVTVASLIQNVFRAAKKNHHGRSDPS